MKKFSDYAKEKDKKELIAFLEKHEIAYTDKDIQVLLEAGWLNSVGRGLRTGALLAAMPAISGANWMPPKELPNPQPYHFSAEKLMDNQQKQQDQEADKAYIAAGGPEFRQTLEDAQEFSKFRSTSQHQQILKKAGLPNNYIPSSVRHFAYGEKISTAEEFSEVAVTVMQNEITKHFGRDMSVRFVGSEDTVTGGKTILVDIVGVVMAFDENDAIKRVETVVREIAKNKGYDLTGFQSASDHHGIEVRPASRSTIDFVQKENAAQPIKVSVRIKLKVK